MSGHQAPLLLLLGAEMIRHPLLLGLGRDPLHADPELAAQFALRHAKRAVIRALEEGGLLLSRGQIRC